MIKCKTCGKEYSPNIYPLHINRCKQERTAKEVQQPEEAQEEEQQEEQLLTELTLTELRSIARDKEVKGFSRMQREELIEILGGE